MRMRMLIFYAILLSGGLGVVSDASNNESKVTQCLLHTLCSHI